MDRRGMVIVGGGECAACAAFALRDAGYAGPVTILGAETHLPYERPPLSKQNLIAGEAPSLKEVASTVRFAEVDITVLTATVAIAIDPDAHTLALADGTMFAYERLLIATGARARELPIAGPPQGRIAYLRTFDDALRIHNMLQAGRHVAVIGGGFIGLEVAASARQRGARVTVIEALPRVLSRVVPEEIAAVIEGCHRRNGVDIHCAVRVENITKNDGKLAIALTGGSSISADFLVVGIGAVPAVDLAKDAGLEVADGIVVDEYLRTSDPDIYAAGDCCSFPLPIYGGRRVRLESWRNAREQGALAGRNMVGASERISGLPWFWSDQYELTLQIAGLPDEGQQIARRTLGDDAFILFHLAGDGTLVAASAIGSGNKVARDLRLAEMLIARRIRPDPDRLSTPDVKLKTLLAA